MRVENTNIAGIRVIYPDVFGDSRGYFFESFSSKKYKEFEIAPAFVQDNISKSVKGTLRGLHLQIGEYAQGKLCQVISGKVLDVAVDVRPDSPTFGKYFSIELSGENHLQVWMPPGFAHGFSVLSDEAIFSYKCTDYYNKESERSILYNDPVLGIDWKIDNPVVSEKDLKAYSFTDFKAKYL
ncbi:MAG TPA: dTDP-4-dehydrorhamnose 3,5-epimerase [Ignavibacteriaceae bacterium]|nr:dTDP-4-dehydrorhamnose 3,5-epimerase [Ignavibacteriaceae bacterium]